MRNSLVPLTVVVLFCSTLATPAAKASVPKSSPEPAPGAARPPAGAVRRPLAPSSLYARRSRRLVQSYLRLKLLEMREADLERAKAVVERKLGIRSLLVETPGPRPR